MLRSVHLKNFVGFKDFHVMDFSNNGPFILIGENGSGKSSILEGMRRCLKLELSTSISSVFDSDKISYFICNVETDSSRSNDVILGIVSNPFNAGQNPAGQYEVQKHSTEEVIYERDASGNESTSKSTIEEYYKFAISNKDKILVDLITLTKSGDETDLEVSESYMLGDQNASVKTHQCIETISNVNSEGDVIEDCIKSILVNLDKDSKTSPDKLKEKLRAMTEQFVFTFPSRSMAPYQWSESKRHTIEHRNENYEEAVKRCEIINFYYDNKDKFDSKEEGKFFKQVTQGEVDNFEQMVTGKSSSKKGRFALIKTPEGILGAKEFSILMSSKQYKTILLEEPERGMHPQFVERMVQIMKQEKNNKRVIFTTHQKGIVTPWTIRDTFIFRRSKKGNRIIFGKSILDKKKIESMKNMRLLTSHNISDIFFARKVLFYEGDSEELLLRELKNQILADECSITSNVFKDNVDEIHKLKNSLIEYTFMKMNGEGQSNFYHEICEKLKLYHLFLLDNNKKRKTEKYGRIFYWSKGDSGDKGTRMAMAKYDGESKDSENKDDHNDDKDGDIESMVLKMCRKHKEIKDGLNEQGVITVISGVSISIKSRQGRGKLFLDERIKCSNITTSVRILLEHCDETDDLALFIKELMTFPENTVNMH